MKLNGILAGILALSFFSFGVSPEKHKFLDNDFEDLAKTKYEKQRIKAVMLDDGLPSTDVNNAVVEFAIGLLGTEYRFGGQSIRGIDCSAFVQEVFSMVGIELPRTARYQAQFGTFVSRENLKPGDLLFFSTYAKFPSHVGIYIGEGKMIHASSAGGKVIISNIDKDYYLRHFLFAKRIFFYDPELAYNKKEKKVRKVKGTE